MAKKIKIRGLDPKGIPLREVIALHRYFRAPAALAANLGDGFLYATNPVFRSVRDEFLLRGFSFTLEDRWDYFSFPLLCLDDILAAGLIPYRRNFAWLERMEKAAAGFTLSDLKKSELQFNYLFHESAHFVAHDVLFAGRPLKKCARNRATLLRILVGEAFANTAECLSYLFSEGEIGGYFLDANCHYKIDEKEARALRAEGRGEGAEVLVGALMASFLYANGLYNSLGSAERARVAKISGARGAKAVRAAIRNGLSLSDSFRDTTTPFHLHKQGFQRLPRLFDFDPLGALARDPALAKPWAKLVGILSRDLNFS